MVRSQKARRSRYSGAGAGIAWAILCLAIPFSSRPCAAKRSFTVADGIELVRFADPPVVFSPDGRYFVVNTERGLPACNRAESTLRVFRTEDVKRFLSGAARSRKLDSGWTLSRATYKDGPIISVVRWLPDSSGIAFLSKTESGRNQLFLAVIATKSVAPITPDDQDVNGFSVRDRRHFVYTALSPTIRERVILEAGAISIVGTGRSLNSLLFPENLHASQQGTHDLSELWAVFAGRRFRVTDKLSGRAIPIHFFGQQALSLSPNGRTVVTAMAFTTIPREWETLYPPAVSTSAYRVRAGQQDPEEFDGDRYISEYVLIDVITGRVKPLINAPIAHATGWWGLPGSDWSKDGNSLVLANTFLPASEERSVIEANRPCGVAIVGLETRNLICLARLNGTSGERSKSGYDYVADVHFLPGSSSRVSVDYLSEDYASRGSSNYIRMDNGNWRIDGNTNAEGTVSSDIDIAVKQGPNNPPLLVSTDRTSNISRVIWDPNPQLRNIELAQVSVVRWRDRTGRDWIGGLYKPPGYVAGSRYPLVIQTHGFDEHAFSPSGSFPTANAAQGLAAAGIMVLQVRDCPVRLTPEEGPCQVPGYEAAVAQLAAQGMVDPDKIGIIGFSRTCYYVLEALSTSALTFKAASITDGIDGGYFEYMTLIDSGENDTVHESNAMVGAPPFGEGLQTWVQRSPEFNMDKVRTPLQVVALGTASVLEMWEPYAALRYLNKPVDLTVLPQGVHVLSNPAELMVSQGGTVDWFSFWLTGREDPAPAKAAQYLRWREMRERQKRIQQSQTLNLEPAILSAVRQNALSPVRSNANPADNGNRGTQEQGVCAEAPDVEMPQHT